MMNLDMHKTGILGGMTSNLDQQKMRECFEVCDDISMGEGVIDKMKIDPTIAKELIKLVLILRTIKMKQIESGDKNIVPELIKALELIARLTDTDVAADLFSSDVDNIKELSEALVSLKHIDSVTDKILEIMEHLTINEKNLPNCKAGGMAASIADIATDEIGDS